MRNFLFGSIFGLCLLAHLCWSGVSIRLAGAENERGSKHISTGRILEFSLRNLKESLQATRQKNDRLSYENIALRKDIEDLQRMLEKLSLKKAKWPNKPSTVHFQENRMPVIEDFDVKEREVRTNELITIFERDVLALQGEIQLLDDWLDHGKFNSQKQLLLDKKKESRETISKIEKRLKILDKRGKGPQRIIEKLESEKSFLERKLSSSKDEIIGY